VRPLPVKPEFGPSLPELLAPRWRRLPRSGKVAVVAVAALLAVLAATAFARGDDGEEHLVVEEPVAFNLRHAEALPRVEPRPGELLRLEGRRGDLFLQSLVVSPLRLPSYEGRAAGAYPIVAERLRARLAGRFDELELVSEGRTRINEVPGYDLIFTARTEEGRRLYGRWIMLVPDPDPRIVERDGVLLQLLGTPAAGVPNAESTGATGQLKLPLRSFRFGTEAP
jgi:hypothetical protein